MAVAPTDSVASIVHGASRVLVIRADDLGDNIMGSGFPPALAHAIPGACGFVGPTAALQLMDVSGLDFVTAVDCRPARASDVMIAGRRIRAAVNDFNPDVVLLPRSDWDREAIGVALLGQRRRSTVTWHRGMTPKRHRRDWWLDLVPGPRFEPADPPVHEFARLQAFASFVGVDPAGVMPSVVRAPDAKIPTSSGPLIAVAPGAAQARRRWPLERYGEVVRTLTDDGYTAVLFGSPDEAWMAQRLRDHVPTGAPVVDLLGRVSLREIAAIMAECVLFVGADSGLGHLAGAVGTPTVIVSCHPVGASATHINAPERMHPVGSPTIAVRPALPHSPACADGCQPVDEPCCITGVAVREVLVACRAQLSETVASASRD